LILGAGLMGAQIGVEYVLGGHDVTLTARDEGRVRERAAAALETLERYGLAEAEELAAARGRLTVTASPPPHGWDIVLESLPEDLDLKAARLRPLAEASPEAILATNTSSLSVGELGERVGAPERTLGTHYWNPPLLMPLVEVVRGERTRADVVERVVETLRALGKRPVVCRDVPGFIWNRLQMAVLREAVWLCEQGVAAPGVVDEVLTFGLARRWRSVGFFTAVALGGIPTWERAARNLLPRISAVEQLSGLERWTPQEAARLAEAAERRDRGLALDLREERYRGAQA
jgi:3-hydroxyacyl-CoA dehydrogenase